MSIAVYPQGFRLVLPKNQQVLNHDSVTFHWTQVNTASQYKLQVSSENDFSNLIIDTTIINTKVVIKLPDCNEYYWKVGVDYGTTIIWSYYRTFNLFQPNCLSGTDIWLLSSDVDTVPGTNRVES